MGVIMLIPQATDLTTGLVLISQYLFSIILSETGE